MNASIHKKQPDINYKTNIACSSDRKKGKIATESESKKEEKKRDKGQTQRISFKKNGEIHSKIRSNFNSKVEQKTLHYQKIKV